MKKKISNLKSFKSIYDIQQALYREIYDYIFQSDFVQNTEIKSYASQFYQSIPSSYKEIDLNEILKEIDRNKVTLVGDFHTLRQNQKGFYKLIGAYRRKYPEQAISIALETFKTEDQIYLDQYMKDEISEFNFLNSIRYRKTWGFSWKSYSKILNFAKQNHIHVFAINSKNDLNNSLYLRDKIAAHTINQRLVNNQNEKVFVLIGEYHLAPNHLPKFIKSSNMRVLFNLDNVFFSNLEFYQEDSEFIQLDDKLYGIINTPSWIKWATYSIWEELQQSKDHYFVQELDDEYTEDHIDIDYQLLSLTKTFCKIMNLKVQTYRLSNFTTIDTFFHSNIKDLIANLHIRTYPLDYINYRLNTEGFFFNFDNSIFLIKEVTPNNLGECMGQLLFRTICNISPKNDTEKFTYRLLLSVSGCITSLILNPKRSTISLDKVDKLENHKTILSCYSWILNRKSPSNIPESYVRHDEKYCGEITCILGQLIGRNLFMSILEDDEADFSTINIFTDQKSSINEILFNLIEKHHL